MRYTVLTISVVILFLHGFLMFRDSSYTLVYPRGGVFSIFTFLAVANILTWYSGQDVSPSKKFQFSAGAWVLLFSTAFQVIYRLYVSYNNHMT
jgi:hypothetical protein